MTKEADELICKLRECEDIELSNIRANREFLNGKQEGYQEAMSTARGIIMQYFKN